MPWLPRAGVEHVGHQHGVVVGTNRRCRAARRSASRYFRSWPILSTLGSSSTGLSAASASCSGIWPAQSLAPARTGRRRLAVAALAMAERHVAGFVVGDRQREAAEARLHRIEAGGLGVDRDDADVLGARDPGLQPVERADGLVFAAVDLAAPCAAAQMGGGQRRGREVAAGPRPCCAACGGGANRSPLPAVRAIGAAGAARCGARGGRRCA